jgi:hypothetical protein
MDVSGLPLSQPGLSAVLLPGLLTILGSWGAAWLSARSAFFTSSQNKTQRLFELALDPAKWPTANAVALQLAVRSVIGADLPGDWIRAALKRDNPLPMLRAMKSAKGMICLTADGVGFQDARERPWGSYRGWSIAAFLAMVLVYIVPSAWFAFSHTKNVAQLVAWIAAEVIVIPFAIMVGVHTDAASRLIKGAAYPFPASAGPHPESSRQGDDPDRVSPHSNPQPLL